MDTGHARDYAAIAHEYARAVAKDRSKTRYCKWVRLACQRYLNDLKRSKRGGWPYYFDSWWANDVCDFIENLPHVEGEWDSETVTLEPAQVFILAQVFGWRRRRGAKPADDDPRRFNTAYLEFARKNAKSTLSSGVALYCLCCEGENGPQVKTAATTGDQARIVFGVAHKMVQRTPELREAFGVQAWSNSITCTDSAGDIKPINAKASTQDGLNPHLTIIDELHAHKERGLFDVLKSARGARKNPLSWYITTAGYNVLGVCYEQRTFVTKVLEGLVEADHYFGIIYTLDEGDDEFDERVWGKANPLLSVSVQLDELRAYAQEAKHSPESHAEFKTKRCNIWTTAAVGHISVPQWQACDGLVDLGELAEVPCWGGLDLAATTDMTAFMLVWRDGDRVKCKGRYYLPEDVVRPRTERGNVPYQKWADAGLLTLTPGNVTDYAYIERDILQTLERFNVQDIAYDPWNARDLVNRLTEQGVPLVEFRQGIPSFAGPMNELDRLYLSGQLDHGGDPVLAWHASNVVARFDENRNMAPSKKHSQEKIDGFVALLMAIGRAMQANVEPTSPWENPEFSIEMV